MDKIIILIILIITFKTRSVHMDKASVNTVGMEGKNGNKKQKSDTSYIR